MRLTALPIVVAIAIGLASPGYVHAQATGPHVRTAGDLAALCGSNPRDPGGPERINYCDGFAQGAVDVELRHATPKPFCIPPGVKREVTLHEFSTWARVNPSRASEEATSGLFHFLAERFPCR
jgi:hypothetical protein